LTPVSHLWHSSAMADTPNLKHIAHQIRGAIAVLKVALHPGMLDDPTIKTAAEAKLTELDQLTDELDVLHGEG